ncbi:MAG: flap endonuclease [Verrucomicrobia bacterium TMED44]|nr:MAG: flap endonuclease [Verrucomicrobia bacterium TMED44]
MSKIFLCDGHNLAFRAFYGIRELSRSDGFPTNMIHGWIKSFWRMEDDFAPDQIWVFFDLGGCPQREKILPDYKANRGAPPEGFSEQLDWVKKLSRAMGYGVSEQEGREADDLIAAKVEELAASHEITIVSADKDLAQLIRPSVRQLLPPPTANPRLGWRLLDEGGVEEKFGVKPTQILDYLSIIGDQADNIPGLSGVGPKTASKWLQNWGSLDEIILNAGRITPKRFCSMIYEKRELLHRNRELIKLDTSIQKGGTIPSNPDISKLGEILKEMEMNQSLEEMIRRY